MRSDPPQGRRPRLPGLPSVDRAATYRLRRRVWSAGRLLFLLGALGLTYTVFFLAALRVASRSRDVTVPSVVGQSLTDAGAALDRVGLTLTVDPQRRADPKVPANDVLEQDPLAGTIVRAPRSIHIRLSEGAQAPVVPAVTGLSERAAIITLGQAHVTVAATAEVRTTDYPPGTVVAQDPPPKSQTDSVRLLVNRAVQGMTYVMPDVIGTPGTRTVDVLRKAGFVVAIVGAVSYPGLPAGIVIRQTPQSGFQVARSETVSLEVSR